VSVAEIPMDGVASAIHNAVGDRWLNSTPFTPEKVWWGLGGS